MARADRVARPARTDEWEIVAADKGVSDDWDRWAKQEPNALATAYDQLSTNPTQLSSRQKRLQGKTMGTGTYDGTTFDRWQYEVTAGGRIFYFVDDPTDGGRKKLERKGRVRSLVGASSSKQSIPAIPRRPSASAADQRGRGACRGDLRPSSRSSTCPTSTGSPTTYEVKAPGREP